MVSGLEGDHVNRLIGQVLDSDETALHSDEFHADLESWRGAVAHEVLEQEVSRYSA